MGNHHSNGTHNSSGSRGEIYYNRNNSQPILFNQIHGDNIEISQGMSVARRNGSFCKAIAFSDRPVKVNERVYLKFIEVSNNWSGVLRFGFTNVNPTAIRNNLPKYLCPDLTSKQGFWAKAFNDCYVAKDGVLSFYVNQAGDVHFGIDGEEKGVFFSGVDVRSPLWLLFDVYGNTTAIKLIEYRSWHNNSRRNNTDNQTENSHRNSHRNSLTSRSTTNSESNSRPTFQFHRTKGKNIELSHHRTIASRLSTEYCNAYVFSARPVRPNDILSIKVLSVEPVYTGSLAFGLTSCDPESIHADILPHDSHLLLDRPEYWVVSKDVATNPQVGEELRFSVSRDGKVQMTKPGASPFVIMHVDTSVPLWTFFDLFGTTQKISIALLPQSETQSASRIENQRPNNLPLSNGHSQRNNNPPTANNTNTSTVSPTSPPITPSSANAHRIDDLLSLDDDEIGINSKPKSNNPPLLDSPSSFELLDDNGLYAECVACCERPVDSVFYNCGHMSFCHSCALEYWKTKKKLYCPICRAKIQDVIRTYKS